MTIVMEWLEFFPIPSEDKTQDVIKDYMMRMYKFPIVTPNWGSNVLIFFLSSFLPLKHLQIIRVIDIILKTTN